MSKGTRLDAGILTLSQSQSLSLEEDTYARAAVPETR